MGFSGFLNCEISGRYRLIGKSSCSFQMDQWSLPLLMRKIGLTPEHLKWQSKTIPIWLFEVCSSILCLSWWIFKCQERVSLFLGFLLASRRIGLGIQFAAVRRARRETKKARQFLVGRRPKQFR